MTVLFIYPRDPNTIYFHLYICILAYFIMIINIAKKETK